MVKSRKHQTKIVGVADFHVFLLARKVNGLGFFFLFGSCRISFSFVCKCRNVVRVRPGKHFRGNRQQTAKLPPIKRDAVRPIKLRSSRVTIPKHIVSTCASRIVSRGKVNELTVAQSKTSCC